MGEGDCHGKRWVEDAGAPSVASTRRAWDGTAMSVRSSLQMGWVHTRVVCRFVRRSHGETAWQANAWGAAACVGGALLYAADSLLSDAQ